MNTFIRNQRNLFKYSSHFPFKSNKYSTTNNKSYLKLKFHLDRNSYNAGASLLGNRSMRISNYSVVSSVGSDNERTTTFAPLYSYNARRDFRLTRSLFEQPSSKVEVTVQTMKNKQKEKVEEIMKEAAKDATAAASGINNRGTAQVSPAEPPKTAVIKKPLKTRIWEEIVHYYHGFRLLFVDINICSKLVWRLLNGKTLTRRENKLLVRTTSDLFRLIPFSVFIIVPFMELLLPVFIKFFPGMLPSTFQTAKEREDKLKQSLQVRLEMAKFLQKTLDEMAVQHKKDHKSEEAKQFAEFFQKIKNPNEYVPNEDIIKFAKRFEDEVTLDSLSRVQLAALCRVLELNTMGTTNLLRFQLRVKLRSLAADDRVIAREGVKTLDLFELQQACRARGMRAYGLTSERLRLQLQEWIDLSLNEKVPPTLLLLSRAMLISDDTTTTDKLKETMRVLPDAVAAETKAAIGEREGKIDNKTKIEIIKEEERKIKEEREEEREEEKAKAEILLDKAPIIDAKKTPELTDTLGKLATDIAKKPSISKPKEILAEADDKNITSKDVELLSEALKTLSSDTKTMMVEKETIKDLKEELQDYKEDVEELREVRNVIQEPVHESRAAKMLFKKVDSMIGKMDEVLVNLEKKEQQIKQNREHIIEPTPEEAALKRKEDELVRIEDLVQTIKKLKQSSDESRSKQIESVLSKLDVDKDGVVTVDEVLKVIEAIGHENVNLDEKQIEEVLTLIGKEQVIEAEEKIEKAILKSLKEAKKQKEDAALKASETLVLDSKDVLKDIAPQLKDTATDLNLDEAKNILCPETKRTLADAHMLEAAEKRNETILPPTKEMTAAMPPKIPPPIPPPTNTATKVNPKDKML